MKRLSASSKMRPIIPFVSSPGSYEEAVPDAMIQAPLQTFIQALSPPATSHPQGLTGCLGLKDYPQVLQWYVAQSAERQEMVAR